MRLSLYSSCAFCCSPLTGRGACAGGGLPDDLNSSVSSKSAGGIPAPRPIRVLEKYRRLSSRASKSFLRRMSRARSPSSPSGTCTALTISSTVMSYLKDETSGETMYWPIGVYGGSMTSFPLKLYTTAFVLPSASGLTSVGPWRRSLRLLAYRFCAASGSGRSCNVSPASPCSISSGTPIPPRAGTTTSSVVNTNG